jgi:hypothetical protein
MPQQRLCANGSIGGAKAVHTRGLRRKNGGGRSCGEEHVAEGSRSVLAIARITAKRPLSGGAPWIGELELTGRALRGEAEDSPANIQRAHLDTATIIGAVLLRFLFEKNGSNPGRRTN